ncbi:hypothetical protein F4678DRAFT_308428 [Xylaria arbuscula]|nr:hypothetical protein F4678DRAFT_308428 [Xylaria arbuscula]
MPPSSTASQPQALLTSFFFSQVLVRLQSVRRDCGRFLAGVQRCSVLSIRGFAQYRPLSMNCVSKHALSTVAHHSAPKLSQPISCTLCWITESRLPNSPFLPVVPWDRGCSVPMDKEANKRERNMKSPWTPSAIHVWCAMPTVLTLGIRSPGIVQVVCIYATTLPSTVHTYEHGTMRLIKPVN